MDRQIEPELMDDKQQVKAYSEADFSLTDRNMCLRIKEFISSICFEISEESLILDLGCGPGNITERLCEFWPLSKVIGIDGSAAMLKVATQRKKNLRNQGYLKSPIYIQEDLTSFSSGKISLEKSAEVLVSNSVLHHMHDPSKFWKAICNLGKEGAVTFHRDLRRPSTYEEAIAIKDKYQPNAPVSLDKDFLASLQAAFTVEEVEMQLLNARLFQLKVFEVDDRYLEIVGVL